MPQAVYEVTSWLVLASLKSKLNEPVKVSQGDRLRDKGECTIGERLFPNLHERIA